ncbi:MAG: flagellar motor switch protein FliM [Pirellulales bacterium]
MADDSLSPAEMGILLSAGKTAPAARRGAQPPPHHLALPGAPFTRADSRPRERQPSDGLPESALARLRLPHQRFAVAAGSALSNMLRCRCEVRAATVQQHSYGEFVRGVESPTCVAVLRAAPLPGEMALEVPLGLLFPMLDRLLGGGREAGPVERRPLTKIEGRLATRLCGALAEQWSQAWREMAQVECSVDRVEGDPRAAQLVLPTEVVVVMTYELSMPGASGRMTLCIPAAVLRLVVSARREPATRGESKGCDPSSPADSKVKLVAQLAPSGIAAAEMLKLAVGDIITTNHDVNAPLELRVDGVPTFLVRPGVAQGHKAVQIVEQADPPAGA